MEKLLPHSPTSSLPLQTGNFAPEERIIGGYILVKPLSLRNALVFRVKKPQDETSSRETFVLKLTKNESAEYEKKFLEKFRGDKRIVQLVEEVEERGIKGLVLEDIHGIDLQDYLETIPEGRLTEDEFLGVAIEMVRALEAVHKRGVIHQDIKLRNYIIQPKTKVVKICDFSLARQFALADAGGDQEGEQLVKGGATLAYISPEQTTRIPGTHVDYRTDLYSLGVTFFVMLTGRFPFESNDLLELIHAHTTVQAPLVNTLVESLSESLSAIVAKLISKNPASRYQSTYGLLQDLEYCRRKLHKTEKEEFVVGKYDVPTIFSIPAKLYGREKETKELLEVFSDMDRNVHSRVVFISGPSGVGKTALTTSIIAGLSDRYIALHGKYNREHRGTPYSGFISCVDEFCHRILRDTEENVEKWKLKILNLFSSHTGLAIDVIPSLELIMGKQLAAFTSSSSASAASTSASSGNGPTSSSVSSASVQPLEMQKRLHTMLFKFIKMMCTEKPLIMFLDDLQWADIESLKLIEALTMRDLNLTIVATYRDVIANATPPHPLAIAISTLKEKRVPLREMELPPLDSDALKQLIEETAPCDSPEVLASLICAKTRGNPFFATQLLKNLVQEHLLWFEYELGRWQYSLVDITQKQITENVVPFMIDRLQKTPRDVQEVLRVAAAIGNRFTYDLVVLACSRLGLFAFTSAAAEKAASPGTDLHHLEEHPEHELHKNLIHCDEIKVRIALRRAVDEEFITEPTVHTPYYAFHHERIQEAAYSLLPESLQSRTHITMGRMMFESTKNDRILLDSQLYDIVDQYDRGLELIQDEKEKYQVAELNLEAGRKAKYSSAYKSAELYLTTGLVLMDNLADAWKEQYELLYSLHYELAECQFIQSKKDAAETHFTKLMQNARSRYDKAKACLMRTTMDPTDGMQTGLIGLKLFGIEFANLDDNAKVMEYLKSVLDRLDQTADLNEVHQWPVCKDPDATIVTQLLNAVNTPAFLKNRNLFICSIAANMDRTLRNRVTDDYSAAVFAHFGYMLVTLHQDDDLAYMCGTIACELLKHKSLYSGGAGTGQILLLTGTFLQPLVEPFRACTPLLEAAYQGAANEGDVTFAGYASAFLVEMSFLAGEPLDRVVKIGTERLTLHESERNSLLLIHSNFLPIAYLASNPPAADAVYPDEMPGEKEFLEEATAQDSYMHPLPHVWFLVVKLIVFYILERWEEALLLADQVGQRWELVSAQPYAPDYLIYHSLVLAALFRKSGLTRKQRFQWLSKVKDNQERMTQYSKKNYQHKAVLVEAELARLEDRKGDAMAYYLEAARGAVEDNVGYLAALSHELCARFFAEIENPISAAAHLQQSLAFYTDWKCKRKIELLQKNLNTAFDPSSVFPPLASPVPAWGRQLSGSSKVGSRGSSFTDASPQIGVLSSSNKSTSSETLALEESTLSKFVDASSIVKASQVLSSEMDLDSLLQKLTTVILQHSSAEWCCVVLADKSSNQLAVKAIATAEKTELMPEAIPLEDYGDHLCVPLVLYVTRTKAHEVLENAYIHGKWTSEEYFRKKQVKSVLCMPIIYQNSLIGALYMENNSFPKVFTPDRIEVLKVLGSQVAISIENAIMLRNLRQYTKELELRDQIKSELMDSNKLLTQMLPESAVQALKSGAPFVADNFKEITVLFTDIVGFTEISSKITPFQLLSMLNEIYSKFDTLVDKYGLYKVETIGDAYMCIGGAFGKDLEKQHAAVVMLAIDMLEVIKTCKSPLGEAIHMRIGIHTGPAYGGVIGLKMPRYCFFGDTINTASRMESNSLPDRCQVSEAAYHKLSLLALFQFQLRGEIEVKGKGRMPTYFLIGYRQAPALGSRSRSSSWVLDENRAARIQSEQQEQQQTTPFHPQQPIPQQHSLQLFPTSPRSRRSTVPSKGSPRTPPQGVVPGAAATSSPGRLSDSGSPNPFHASVSPAALPVAPVAASTTSTSSAPHSQYAQTQYVQVPAGSGNSGTPVTITSIPSAGMTVISFAPAPGTTGAPSLVLMGPATAPTHTGAGVAPPPVVLQTPPYAAPSSAATTTTASPAAPTTVTIAPQAEIVGRGRSGSAGASTRPVIEPQRPSLKSVPQRPSPGAPVGRASQPAPVRRSMSGLAFTTTAGSTMSTSTPAEGSKESKI